MNTPLKVPYIPKDLLEYLDRQYPEASAIPGKSHEELMFNGGRRELIRWLWVQYYRQEKGSETGGLEAVKINQK